MLGRLVLLATAMHISCGALAPDDSTPTAQTNRTPEQLAEFLRANDKAIVAGDAHVLARLDALCGQHDCRSSKLFWFTDLEEAKARAQQEGKPILSLRMFGKLTDPLSCANSRFFRSVLYPDPAIGKLLRERFVLHWQQVRAVPKVTIDFGDGRVMQRTLTGNSAHYVLDNDGRPLDAIPGLVSPRAFERMLHETAELAALIAPERAKRDQVLATWHRRHLEALVDDWTRQLRTQGVRGLPKRAEYPEATLETLDAMTRAIGYARLASGVELAHEVEDRIAARFPDAWRANDRAPTKAILESPILRGLRQIRETLGRDSIENELWHRGRIHGWFMRGEIGVDPVALDRRVYAELFLSPLDDPWYGLMPPPEMRALDDCAVMQKSQ